MRCRAFCGPMKPQALDSIHFLNKRLAQRLVVFKKRLYGTAQNPLHALRQARDADGIVRPGLKFIRHEFRLHVLFRKWNPCRRSRSGRIFSPGQAGCKSAPGPQRTHKPLVAREGQQVDAIRLHINGHMPRALCGIHQQRNPQFPRQPANFPDWLQRPRDI